jgi:hypothetical protein
MADDWIEDENDEIVADYFAMLAEDVAHASDRDRSATRIDSIASELMMRGQTAKMRRCACRTASRRTLSRTTSNRLPQASSQECCLSLAHASGRGCSRPLGGIWLPRDRPVIDSPGTWGTVRALGWRGR